MKLIIRIVTYSFAAYMFLETGDILFSTLLIALLEFAIILINKLMLKIYSDKKLYSMTVACVEEKNYEKALCLMRRIIRRQPANMDFIFKYGYLKYQLDVLMPRGLKEQIDFLNYSKEEVSFSTGYGLECLGRYEEAIRMYNVSIEEGTQEYLSINHKTCCLINTGRIDEAIINGNKAIGLFPYEWEAYRYLGDAHHANGNSEQALENYKKALIISPKGGDKKLRDNLSESIQKCEFQKNNYK